MLESQGEELFCGDAFMICGSFYEQTLRQNWEKFVVTFTLCWDGPSSNADKFEWNIVFLPCSAQLHLSMVKNCKIFSQKAFSCGQIWVKNQPRHIFVSLVRFSRLNWLFFKKNNNKELDELTLPCFTAQYLVHEVPTGDLGEGEKKYQEHHPLRRRRSLQELIPWWCIWEYEFLYSGNFWQQLCSFGKIRWSHHPTTLTIFWQF